MSRPVISIPVPIASTLALRAWITVPGATPVPLSSTTA
jgi:hypothetical protein